MPSPEALAQQQDILARLDRWGIPRTRENYLILLLKDNPNRNPTPEHEADLPEEFQLKD